MGRPHVRMIFVDPMSSQITWCGKQESTRASVRGGMLLENLQEVRD
jgi:hypothetical protein